MFFNKKDDDQQKGKKKKLVTMPGEPKRCMGECPHCGSRRTTKISPSGSPTKDAKHEIFSQTHGVPISYISLDEYRDAISFGMNAVCRDCSKYFKGKKEPFITDEELVDLIYIEQEEEDE